MFALKNRILLETEMIAYTLWSVMERKWLFLSYTIGLTLIGIACDAFATTAKDFGGDEIITQAATVKTFLFGPIMRVAGVIGGAYGLIQAILSSSIKPLIVFGGIGLAVNIIPKFIDGIYGVSGMMLP